MNIIYFIKSLHRFPTVLEFMIIILGTESTSFLLKKLPYYWHHLGLPRSVFDVQPTTRLGLIEKKVQYLLDESLKLFEETDTPLIAINEKLVILNGELLTIMKEISFTHSTGSKFYQIIWLNKVHLRIDWLIKETQDRLVILSDRSYRIHEKLNDLFITIKDIQLSGQEDFFIPNIEGAIYHHIQGNGNVFLASTLPEFWGFLPMLVLASIASFSGRAVMDICAAVIRDLADHEFAKSVLSLNYL